jgi:hypothetical protein
MTPFLAVDELHQQRPLHMKLGHLVERRGREKNLGTVVELWPLVAGSHDDGVASVVFVESLYNRSSAVTRHVVEVIRVARIKVASKSRLILEDAS